ncbi:dihydroxyacetone kinase phosphoryl donor subunit DhaM [Numidum massiliense]|uniref:dihydroxyacetone kinase phosphoryl donor subunit DhaM n=1 Tax=Numidum massiliense TaxID=1522315 RepID=UPI0006D5910A|nr:dihydroxyacetone kinase phosphoryl donor subunit DhaM [Numidum massiliense]
MTAANDTATRDMATDQATGQATEGASREQQQQRRQAALVLVSHSEQLATGLQALIKEMATDVTVLTAAGDGEGGLGTQVDAIEEAIRATEAAHVLLFFDLGSALMNAEMATEMLAGEAVDVTIVDAPLVEGAFAAAMALQTGRDAEEAVRAAEKARREPKVL